VATPDRCLRGSFVYPLEPNLVALGLVVGLDYRDVGLDVHVLLQRFKQHPLLKPLLAGGEMVEWGAKTIPEGGFYSLPERRSGMACCCSAMPRDSWTCRHSRAFITRCNRGSSPRARFSRT